MNRIEKAKELLINKELTCVAVKEDFVYESREKGIKPILGKLVESDLFFTGASVADKVIGRSAAMLLIKGGIKDLYAVVLSEHAKRALDASEITYTYGKLVPYIINREQTGMCPMEASVLEAQDPEEAFIILLNKMEQMKR